MLESEMVKNSVLFLNSQNRFPVIKQEVPFLSRCIDLVLIDSKGRIISIEFKINNWRHAIEQACNHKLGSDKAYICIPKRTITDSLSSAIKDAGIGLLFYDSQKDEPIYEVISPPVDRTNITAFKQILLSNLHRLK